MTFLPYFVTIVLSVLPSKKKKKKDHYDCLITKPHLYSLTIESQLFSGCLKKHTHLELEDILRLFF